MPALNDKDLKIAYQAVFSSEDGQEVLKHIFAKCSMDTPTYDQNGKPENTFYNEGRRSVALMLLRMLDRDSARLTVE